MRRVEFVSPDLADFVSPRRTTTSSCSSPIPARRAASPCATTRRAPSIARRTLTIDFALHDAGPATAWARAAQPGATLEIGGPRGSLIVADDFDFYLLIGDETALPAIGRRLEGLRPGVPVATLVLVDGPDEIQAFATRADWRPVWICRAGRGADDGALLLAALAAWRAPEGDGYVWIAAEAEAARALKAHMLGERGHPPAWLKAAGYWVRGRAGESEKLDR